MMRTREPSCSHKKHCCCASSNLIKNCDHGRRRSDDHANCHGLKLVCLQGRGLCIRRQGGPSTPVRRRPPYLSRVPWAPRRYGASGWLPSHVDLQARARDRIPRRRAARSRRASRREIVGDIECNMGCRRTARRVRAVGSRVRVSTSKSGSELEARAPPIPPSGCAASWAARPTLVGDCGLRAVQGGSGSHQMWTASGSGFRAGPPQSTG